MQTEIVKSMGYRLNVAKKYVIEYADIEAFNWKILEFHNLLSACGAQYTGEVNDLNFEVMKEDWEMMIGKISSLDSREDDEEKVEIEECLAELECPKEEVIRLLKEYLEQSDPDRDVMFLSFI